MLDAKAIVETEFVRRRELTPELFVTRGRGHARFIPDMGEVSEFHGGSDNLGGVGSSTSAMTSKDLIHQLSKIEWSGNIADTKQLLAIRWLIAELVKEDSAKTNLKMFNAQKTQIRAREVEKNAI